MVYKELAYKQVDDLDIMMDMYLNDDRQAPLLVYIHGGALIWGSRKDLTKYHIDTFLQGGLSVCSIDYRLAPETSLDAIIKDVEDAIGYLRHEALKALDIAPRNLTVVGGSAGGYLSLMSGTYNERPDKIVSLYGYGDILADWYGKPDDYYCKFHTVTEEEALACVGEEPLAEGPQNRFNYYLYCRQQGSWVERVASTERDEAELKRFCPIHCIDEGYPPTLLIHGDKDNDVPYEESVKMHQALKEQGIASKLLTAEGYGHAFDYMDEKEMTKTALQAIIHFIKA